MKDRDTTGMYGTIPTWYHYVHTVMRECGFVATHTSYVMCTLLFALVAGLGMVGTIVVCALYNYSAAFQLCYITLFTLHMIWYGMVWWYRTIPYQTYHTTVQQLSSINPSLLHGASL